MLKVFILLLFLYLFIPLKSYAALYINEFSSKTSPDWVEIYNSGPDSVDLSEYQVKDSSSTNTKELSGSLASGSFTTFDWSDYLNNSGDTIKLIRKSDNSVIDEIIYGSNGTAAPSENQTSGRSPDGSANWSLFSSASKGSTNNSSTVVPTATPNPTNTPTPTPTPKPDPTNTPTPTPSPTKSPTPTSAKTTPAKSPTPLASARTTTPKPTAKSQIGIRDGSDSNGSVGKVLGSNSLSVNDKMPSIPKDPNTYNWGKLFIIMGGVVATVGIGVLLYNNYREEKLEEV